MAISVSDEQAAQLLRDVPDIYGYDFSDYSKASLMRRINRLVALDASPALLSSGTGSVPTRLISGGLSKRLWFTMTLPVTI